VGEGQGEGKQAPTEFPWPSPQPSPAEREREQSGAITDFDRQISLERHAHLVPLQATFDNVHTLRDNTLMKQRVSLTIDSKVIRKAKQIAQQRHTSASQLVEDLLSHLTQPSAKEPEDLVEKGLANSSLSRVTFTTHVANIYGRSTD
jgi:hypothetical protein